MRDSLTPLLFFGCGILLGVSDMIPEVLHLPWLPVVILSLLMVQVGIGLGVRKNLFAVFKSLHWSMFLLPVFTIVGTLIFSAFALFLFRDESLKDILAVGSGFGYYSLSSVLIVEIKSAAVGLEKATQLAAIALLANVIREVFALLCCSAFARKGKENAAISIAGINSMDVCLPLILGRDSSKSLLPVAIFHGLVLEISVPLLVTLFCQ
ncbi:MAG: lysine exporter LysO family protein [Bacteroides sp.]|nr:lysine exporter LysO family protein [Roseburia sp.]MCM1345926.1 lysine exporter LysO family protein [Bacteroides sp.]MCM1420091.1 lysine exporter LysO family protein [Bacteroides sp.]